MELTKKNYFSKEMSQKYISVSQLKDFKFCEYYAMQRLLGSCFEEKKKVFTLGSYFHAWAENTLPEFIEDNKEQIFKKTGKKDKLADFQLVDRIIERLEKNENGQYDKLLGLITDQENQKEVIFTTKLYDADFKIMIDILNPNYIVDLKLLKSIRDKFFNPLTGKYENFIKHYKYDYQMTIYSLIHQLATKREFPLNPILACITKSEIPETALFIGFNKKNDDNYIINEEIIEGLPIQIQRVQMLKEKLIEPEFCGVCSECLKVLPTKVLDYNKLYV